MNSNGDGKFCMEFMLLDTGCNTAEIRAEPIALVSCHKAPLMVRASGFCAMSFLITSAYHSAPERTDAELSATESVLIGSIDPGEFLTSGCHEPAKRLGLEDCF